MKIFMFVIFVGAFIVSFALSIVMFEAVIAEHSAHGAEHNVITAPAPHKPLPFTTRDEIIRHTHATKIVHPSCGPLKGSEVRILGQDVKYRFMWAEARGYFILLQVTPQASPTIWLGHFGEEGRLIIDYTHTLESIVKTPYGHPCHWVFQDPAPLPEAIPGKEGVTK